MNSPATSTEPIDVFGLGVVAVDDFLYVDAYPPADSKVPVRRVARDFGGQTGRALLAAARAGYRTAYGGMLGDDPLSEAAKAAFREAGVDLSRHVSDPLARPFHSTIIVDETNHTRTIFARQGGKVGCADDGPAEEAILAARVLLIDHHGVKGTLRAARIAVGRGTPVVADFERNGEGPFEELFELANHLIVPRRFAAERTGAEDPAEAARRLWTPRHAAVVVTCGADGGWYRAAASEQVRHYQTSTIEAVNTTGCGDVFHGIYAAALASGAGVEKCVRLAAEAAAHHARGGLPVEDAPLAPPVASSGPA